MIGAGAGGTAVVLDFVGRDGVSKTARRVETEIKKTGKAGEQAGRKIQKSFTGVGRSFGKLERQTVRMQSKFRKLAAITAGLFAGAKFAGAIRDASRMADEIDKLSIRLGISTEALSQLRFAAELSGVGFNTLTMGMQRMTRRISEAAVGTGEAVKALQELNLSAAELNRLSPDKQFERIADALADVGNSADQVRLAMRLFDSEGVALLQIMQDGANGIARMRDEADRLGVTLTQAMASKIVQARDAMTKLNFAFQAFALNFAAGLSADTQRFAEALAVLGEVASKVAQVFSRFVILVSGAGAALAQFFSGDFEAAGRVAEETLDKVFSSLNQKAEAFRNKPVVITPGVQSAGSTPDGFKQIEEALQRRNELLDVTISKSREAAELLQGKQNAEQSLGRNLTGPEEAKVDALIAKRQQLTAAVEKQRESEQKTAALASQMSNSLSSSFERAIFEGGKFGDLLKDLGVEMAKMVLQAALLRPFANMLAGGSTGGGGSGGIAGAVGGLFGFAHGGAFRVGGSGGTDSQLVAFKASPNETVHVMPPSASMGGGANVEIVVNVTNNASNNVDVGVQTSGQDALKQVGKQAIDIVISEVDKRISNGGSTGQAISRTFGLRNKPMGRA